MEPKEKKKSEYKAEENDNEINFAIFLNANANYALLQIFHKYAITFTSFYDTNKHYNLYECTVTSFCLLFPFYKMYL